MRTRADGMSLIELTIAMALLLALTAGIVGTLAPAQSASAFEPEAADVQQRVRVAADTLFTKLNAAGAGPSTGGRSSALLFAIAPVLPFRYGGASGDPPGAFAADRISIISVPPAAAWTTLSVDLAPGVTTLQAERQAICPPGVNLCGFAPGLRLLVFDATGSFDTFALAAVDDASAQLQVASRPASSSSTTFKAGATVVEARVDVYSLKADVGAGSVQLVHGDGSSSPDAPAVDHLVGLAFEYYGEPRAPALIEPTAEMPERRTTYGFPPPPLHATTTLYPAGENCVFRLDATGEAQVSRLPDLAADTALINLTAGQLTDGPWCPDAFSGNRWDADLLRVRSVVVTVRLESALTALRGPAGVLFTNAGTSRNRSHWIPDVERRFAVTPPNMNVAR